MYVFHVLHVYLYFIHISIMLYFINIFINPHTLFYVCIIFYTFLHFIYTLHLYFIYIYYIYMHTELWEKLKYILSSLFFIF